MRLFFCLTMLLSTPTATADEISGNATAIDGDTIKVWEISIRLEGIDAPEIAQACTRPSGRVWPCGEEAADRLRRILSAKTVRCRGDEKDQYGRLIATCFIDDENLNRRLVLDGWAVAFVRFSDTYVAEEQEARAARVGIWNGTFIRPVDFRAARYEEEKGSSKTGIASTTCVIKGNINSKGEKIYHTPWSSRHYEQTKIDTGKGERWFCDEAEAVAAGWRPPYR